MKISILMLTHDAPAYVEIAIRSLAKYTRNIPYELIVVDNASEPTTRNLLDRLSKENLISRVLYLEHNSLFAGGNNIAARMASPDSSHLLLLNSDVKVKDSQWLKRLVDNHNPGISSYGVCENPLRVDGYCLLVDRDIYLRHLLDEKHQWFWAVTKFQAAVLREGYAVQGFAEHERFLHHFGGRSGTDYKSAMGISVPQQEIVSWFNGKMIKVLDALPSGALPRRRRSVIRLLHSRLWRLFR